VNLSRTWLALAAVAWFALPGASAPAPAPDPAPLPPGPLSDALRLRDRLPKTPPLLVSPAVMAGEGVIELERRALVTIEKRVNVTVKRPDGATTTEVYAVTEVVPHAVKVRVMVKACKFFTVTREGKLEALDAAKATALLKKKTAVLTGQTAEVDPRTLELVKPGTLCVILVHPFPYAPPPPAPPPPANKEG
jgi:hypothetical protein